MKNIEIFYNLHVVDVLISKAGAVKIYIFPRDGVSWVRGGNIPGRADTWVVTVGIRA